MKAILVKEKGGAENLVLQEYHKPVASKGSVLIRIRAFGLNRAEIYMRKGEFGPTSDIIGIECVGTVESDPSGEWKEGQTVVALVGGMGRWINGSYAEYTSVPKTNVVPIQTQLPWNELAAIPESYATAWAILHWCLASTAGEILLIRGATSTIGQAGIVLAKQLGMHVIATTRNPEKTTLLRRLGAQDVIVDTGALGPAIATDYPRRIDKIMELVGTSTLLDSIACLRPMGSICLAGFLGGMQPLEQFQPVFQLPTGIRLTTLASALAFGEPGYELSKIPLQTIVSDIEQGRLPNILSRTFPAAKVVDAHRLMESNTCNGKIVVQW